MTKDEAITALDYLAKCTSLSSHYTLALQMGIEALNRDAHQPRKGKWIKRNVSLYRCSECGRFSPSQENYCPSCGSYNREEKTNE